MENVNQNFYRMYVQNHYKLNGENEDEHIMNFVKSVVFDKNKQQEVFSYIKNSEVISRKESEAYFMNIYENSKNLDIMRPLKKEEYKIVEMCNSLLDFNDPVVRKNAINYIRYAGENYIGSQKSITPMQLNLLYSLIAKISINDLKLDTKIEIRESTRTYTGKKVQEKTNATAYFLDSDNKITFHTESFWPTKNGQTRTDFNDVDKISIDERKFNYFVSLIEHEIEHAVQYKMQSKMFTNKFDVPQNIYRMNLEEAARILSIYGDNNRYYSVIQTRDNGKEIYKDGMYVNNHDANLIEIDANHKGFVRGLSFLKEVLPNYYSLDKEQYTNLAENLGEQLKKVEGVMWTHNTNPNNAGVPGTYKASLMIDTLLPGIKNSLRKEVFKQYPSLSFAYNENGQKKTLDQIEYEKYMQLSEVFRNARDENVDYKAGKVSSMYDCVIESNALLSFEYAIRHIARVSWDSEKYFVSSPLEINYSPKNIRQELKNAQDKAMNIASYIEEYDIKSAKNIINRYKKELQKNKDKKPNDLRFYEDKLKLIEGIEKALIENKDYKSQLVIEKQQLKAKQMISSMFINLNLIMDNSFYDEQIEKIMVTELVKDYARQYAFVKNKNYLSVEQLQNAIKTAYPFTVSEKEEKQYTALKNSGKITNYNTVIERDAKQVLEKVFKDVKIEPKKYLTLNDETTVSFNRTQKARLMLSLQDYTKAYNKLPQNEKTKYVSSIDARNAINILYPFNFTEQEKNKFEELDLAGEIEYYKTVLSTDKKEEKQDKAKDDELIQQ